jgi:hypothetical protein
MLCHRQQRAEANSDVREAKEPRHVEDEASEVTEGEKGDQPVLSPPQHEYDSIAHTKPFYGDVSMPGVLARAARARAYRKELIVFVSTACGFGPAVQ